MSNELSAETAERATQAGLGRAVQDFPADVAEAAAAALAATGGLKLPDDPAAEPWPPMRVGHPA